MPLPLDILRLHLATCTALHASLGRAVNVVSGDPALVISLIIATGSAFTTGYNLLLYRDPNFLCSPGLLRLREKCLEIGLVDKVACTGEGARQEEVQEDTGKLGQASLRE